MGQPRGCPLSYPSLFAMATSCCHPFSAISPLTDAYGFAPIPRHYVQSIQHLFDRSNMAKQNCSHRANVICDGSPSRIFRVRRISLGMTTRPRSSMRRTIPVAFISVFLRFLQFPSYFLPRRENYAKSGGVSAVAPCFPKKKAEPRLPGGRKTVKSKNGENLVFSRGGVTSVTPFPFLSAHSEG